MTDEVLESFTRQYIEAQQVPEVTFGWQGGEPLLMGIDFFERAVTSRRSTAKPGMRIINTLQTNGTLIDEDWASFFHEHNFLIGLSLDGPRSARRLPGGQGRQPDLGTRDARDAR